MEHEKLNTVGERLTYCRKLIDKTKSLVAANLGLSANSYGRWENNIAKVSYLKMTVVLSFFQAEGLTVTREWLMDGVGEKPTKKPIQTVDNTTKNLKEEISETQGKTFVFDHLKLKKLMIDNGFSTAYILKKTSISSTTTNKLLAGESLPNSKTVMKLADLFKIKPSDLYSIR